MTLRSVIFDLDCTLADRLRSIDTYLDRFLERFGDSLRAVDRQIVRAALGHADAGGYAADTRAADIVAALDWGKTPWRGTFPECAVAMDGTLDVLDELREDGMALGILTNGSVQAQEAKIAHLDLSDRRRRRLQGRWA
jgi:putative hydrolase of the HAD superfamily